MHVNISYRFVFYLIRNIQLTMMITCTRIINLYTCTRVEAIVLHVMEMGQRGMLLRIQAAYKVSPLWYDLILGWSLMRRRFTLSEVEILAIGTRDINIISTSETQVRLLWTQGLLKLHRRNGTSKFLEAVLSSVYA